MQVPLGPQGLEEVACVSRQRMQETVEALAKVGVPLAFPQAPFFNEAAFRLSADEDVTKLRAALRKENIFGAIPLSCWYPGLKGCFTLACTERTQPEDIVRLVKVAARFAREGAVR